MTTPGWSDEKHGGSLRWLEFTFTVVLIILPVDLGFLYFGALQMEAQRRKGKAPPPGGRGAGVPSKGAANNPATKPPLIYTLSGY